MRGRKPRARAGQLAWRVWGPVLWKRGVFGGGDEDSKPRMESMVGEAEGEQVRGSQGQREGGRRKAITFFSSGLDSTHLYHLIAHNDLK